jgi:hypothetical protein
MSESKNPNAVALGKMGRGVPKTMSAAAMRARKRAAKFPRPSRRKENNANKDQNVGTAAPGNKTSTSAATTA